MQDIKEAIKISPADKNLRDEFEKIKELKKKANEQQSKAARTFFSQGLYNEKEAAITKDEKALPQYEQTNPHVFLDLKVGSGKDTDEL